MSYIKDLQEIRKRLVEARKLKEREEAAAAGITTVKPVP